MATYGCLQNGMTLEQVTQVLGNPGEEQYSGNGLSGRLWKDGNGGMLSITFQNGRLAGKSQTGLKD
jgi:hypothetical protein